MNQGTKPAPFNVGDHVCYVAVQRRVLPAGQGNGTELVLTPGMEGVIVLSAPAHSLDHGRWRQHGPLALPDPVSEWLSNRHHAG